MKVRRIRYPKSRPEEVEAVEGRVWGTDYSLSAGKEYILFVSDGGTDDDGDESGRRIAMDCSRVDYIGGVVYWEGYVSEDPDAPVYEGADGPRVRETWISRP